MTTYEKKEFVDSLDEQADLVLAAIKDEELMDELINEFDPEKPYYFD